MASLSKALVILFALFAIQAFAKSKSEEGLEEFYEGFYARVFQPEPTTVMGCYNETTANLTMNFLGKFIKHMSKNQVHLVPATVTAYLLKLPQGVSKCLAADEELQHVYTLYGIQGKTLQDMAVALSQFAFLHYIKYRSTLTVLDANWEKEFYYEAGRVLGELTQACFKSKEINPDFFMLMN